MIHCGDITKLSGYELPTVDVITGGSPCQDLSITGKRKGLDGERSGLFMEQIRIVKEMREHDRANGRTGYAVRPRYMVWENVKGAFSSNKGRDFQAVLTEIIRIAEPNAPDVPMPENGRWPHAGCLYSDVGGWSVAWRLHDAQFWGVPQRRERICVVADFGGMSAPEILFERKGLSGHSDPCKTAGEGTAGAVAESIRTSGGDIVSSVFSIEGNGTRPSHKGDGYSDEGVMYTLNSTEHHAVAILNDQGGACVSGEDNAKIAPTLRAECHGHVPVAYSFDSMASNSMKSKNPHSGCREVEIAKTLDCSNPDPSKNQGGMAIVQQGVISLTSRGAVSENVTETLRAMSHGALPMVYDARGNGDGKTVPTITGDHGNRVTDYTALCIGNGQLCNITMSDTVNTLDTMHDQQAVSVDCRNGTESEVNGTLQSDSFKTLNGNNVCRCDDVVRRLTPLECERLQGFPDNWTLIGEPAEPETWTDERGQEYPVQVYKTVNPITGKTTKVSDTARYRALGNSIALSFWFWVLRRISAQYERPATLGSLFDGIGGFPLCWERCNGRGTAIWASEIDPFCIAVTTERFGGNPAQKPYNAV